MNERSVRWKFLFEVPIIQNCHSGLVPESISINWDKFNFHSEANEIFSKNFAVLIWSLSRILFRDYFSIKRKVKAQSNAILFSACSGACPAKFLCGASFLQRKEEVNSKRGLDYGT
jgi:hypothetical protein